jgi:hypothetical protein
MLYPNAQSNYYPNFISYAFPVPEDSNFLSTRSPIFGGQNRHFFRVPIMNKVNVLSATKRSSAETLMQVTLSVIINHTKDIFSGDPPTPSTMDLNYFCSSKLPKSPKYTFYVFGTQKKLKLLQISLSVEPTKIIFGESFLILKITFLQVSAELRCVEERTLTFSGIRRWKNSIFLTPKWRSDFTKK